MIRTKVNPKTSFVFDRTGLVVNQRTVLAAMTNKQSNYDGTVSDKEIQWLTRRAVDGFGIITTAAANVSKDGQGWEGEIGVYDDKHIDNLNILTKSINNNTDSLIFSQLFHGGMRAPESITGQKPISASRIKTKDSFSGYTRPASSYDIERLIADFTDAANRCVHSGFDGIELHGAHGYLISQFLGKKSNLRKDKWGGDLIGRSRFLIEIIRSIKKIVPDSFIVGIRISPELNSLGIDIDDSISLAKLLSNEGVDFIHLSCWDSFSRSKKYPDDPKRLTEWFTHSIENLPAIITTGSIWSFDNVKSVFEQGSDLIGVGRAGIAYPDWSKYYLKKNFNPYRGPFTVQHLKDVDLSEVFINYMRNWEGFVK